MNIFQILRGQKRNSEVYILEASRFIFEVDISKVMV